MANVMFKKGLLAGLPSTYAEGTFYVTTDERAIYLDISDSARIRLGDFQEFETLAALQANTNPSTSALYYISGLNVLAKWNGTEYVQINLDTGATSFEVVGNGNAITTVSYDAATRKLTLTKGETFATKAELDELDTFVGDIPEGYTEATVIAYINKKAEEVLAAAQGGSSETAASVKLALDNYKAENDPKVAANTAAIEALEEDTHTHENADVLNGITSEKVAEWDAKQDAGDYATKAEAQGYADAKDEAIAAAKKAGDDAMAEAQAKVASVAAGDASVTVAGTSTAPTVAVKLDPAADNAIKLGEDGLKVQIGAAPEYTIVKAESSGDYAAVYNLTKDGTIVGASINIPKDMVVESGSVVENPDGQAEGTYIELKLQNVADPLYINVGSLIEYVTSGSVAGDMVVIAVSDDHKVTATITDGSITLAKLSTDIQTAIGKAHNHENADVLAGINADKVAAWDAAEANAEKHADDLNTAMDTRVKAVEDKAHEHANQAELDKIAEGDKAKWDAAQANAEATAAAALAAAKEELEGDIAAAQAAAEKVANDNDTAMDTRVKALEDIDHDAYVDADAKVLADAKTYADEQITAALTWGSF